MSKMKKTTKTQTSELQNTTQIIKDRPTRTPKKPEGELQINNTTKPHVEQDMLILPEHLSQTPRLLVVFMCSAFNCCMFLYVDCYMFFCRFYHVLKWFLLFLLCFEMVLSFLSCFEMVLSISLRFRSSNSPFDKLLPFFSIINGLLKKTTFIPIFEKEIST